MGLLLSASYSSKYRYSSLWCTSSFGSRIGEMPEELLEFASFETPKFDRFILAEEKLLF